MWVGAGSGLGFGLELVSKAVFWAFSQNIPSYNTGTTRGPHQIPRFLYFILDNNPFVRQRRHPLVAATSSRPYLLFENLVGTEVCVRDKGADSTNHWLIGPI